MMKKLIVTALVLLLAVSIISLIAAEFSLATAGASQSQGADSPQRNQHMDMDHDERHEDRRHVGIDTDLSGDDNICEKHVGRDRNI